jgi:oxygen-dependent protoporphyrinogen oxidase
MTTGSRGSVAVVGSGAAGIASAYRLYEAGFQVRLLERNDHLGGRMRTVSRDGFRMEQGATAIPCSYTSILGVARDAGLGDELVPATGVFGFMGHDGALHEIDAGRPLDGLTTKLVSHRSKLRGLRLAAEVLRFRSRIDVEDLSPLAEVDTMSADAYGRRLMGDQLFSRIADPIIRSLEGCGPEKVSAVDLLFVFGKFLSDPNFVVFRGGMQSYSELMASRFDVELEAEVVEVTEREDGVELRWGWPAGLEMVERFDGVVLACDANTVAGIHRGLDQWRRDFLREQVRFTRMTACTVAVDPAPDLRACLIFPAPDVRPNSPMIALEHNIVAGRAPEGQGIVTLYPSAETAGALSDEADDVVAKQLIEAASPVVPGLAESVLWTQVWRHEPCVVQSRPGYWKAMGEFRARSAAADGRIRLAGDYFCVSNLNSASASGERAARELIAHLTPDGSTA